MSDQPHVSAFEAPSLEEVSRLFPAYEIHHLIACGGMGAVYYATQLSLDRFVAIKILPREFADDVDFRESFEAEAKAMAKLNHPNLIGIYDFGKVEGMFFIVMEFIEGQSLYHLTHHKAVEKEDAIRLILGVCEGLSHAHEYGILHRDIKPSNILLDAAMNPKIGDFGLAQAMGKAIQDGEQIFGTPGYTAPEVIEPPHQFDQRADVFSVAVMFQELLTGRSPNPDKLLDDELAVRNPRLCGVIRAGIDPDPRYRTKTVAEFADALRKLGSAKKGVAVATRPLAGGALAKPAVALGKPAGALGAPRPMKRPQQSVSKQSGESSGIIWMVLLLLVVGAVVVFVITKKRGAEAAQVPAGKQTTGAVATSSGSGNDAGSSVKEGAGLDIESALRTARSASSQRFSPDHETYKRDLREIAEKLKNDLKEKVPESVDLIEENFASWQSNGYRIAGALPNQLSRHSGVSALHRSAIDEQRAAADRLDERIKNQSGMYVMELENLVETMKAASDDSGVQRLEDEIRRVREGSDYFRSLMLK